MRRYHRNPIMKMLSGSEMKGVGQLAINSALIVGGVIGSKLILDKLSAKFPALNTPYVKIGSQLALAAAVYIVGSRVKKIPARIVNMLALGMMVPAATEAYDMIKAKNTGSVATVSYAGLGAFVPQQQMGAYVPAKQLGSDYGNKY